MLINKRGRYTRLYFSKLYRFTKISLCEPYHHFISTYNKSCYSMYQKKICTITSLKSKENTTQKQTFVKVTK